MKLISGSSNKPLANKIAQQLGLEVIDINISKFANGEKNIIINDNLRGENVCLVQSFSNPVDENIIEFLLIADALKRMGVRHINLVLPWMGYSLQDKVFTNGSPISAKVVADLISNSGIKRLFILDLHNTSIPGFFSIPAHHDTAMELFVDYANQNFDQSKSIVVSPDFGGLKRARVFADKMNLDLVNIDKHRDYKTGQVTPVGISGDVQDKICLIYDDVINTGGTVIETAKYLKDRGAKEVHFLITHGLFAGNGLKLMENNSIDSVVITNSINHDSLPARVKVINCAPIFAENLKKWL
jgi:ribose-phosphate pyrophosphokinase